MYTSQCELSIASVLSIVLSCILSYVINGKITRCDLLVFVFRKNVQNENAIKLSTISTATAAAGVIIVESKAITFIQRKSECVCVSECVRCECVSLGLVWFYWLKFPELTNSSAVVDGIDGGADGGRCMQCSFISFV